MTTEELIKELKDWASLDEGLVDNPSPEWLESHKLLHLAATRLRELHDANRWRPMEDAPKDGTVIVGAVFPDGYPPIFFDCMWKDGFWVSSDDGDLDNLPQYFFIPPQKGGE